MKEDNSKNNFSYSYVDMETVANNIDEYIIPECQEACKNFWAKNIFTFMCSNRDEGEVKYILLNKLSPENEEIFKRMCEEDPHNYFFDTYRQTFGIRAYGEGEEVSEQLSKLTEKFKMQDVLEGYWSRENFLIDKFNMFKTLCNGEEIDETDFNFGENYFLNESGTDEYEENDAIDDNNNEPKPEDYDDISDFFKALNEYYSHVDNYSDEESLEDSIEELNNNSGMQIVFDETKMTKSFEEYLEESGYADLYDQEREIVYYSDFYKIGHLRYLEYLKRSKNIEDKDNTSNSNLSNGNISVGDDSGLR